MHVLLTVYSGTEWAVVFCARFQRLMFCQHLENTVVSFTRDCSCEDVGGGDGGGGGGGWWWREFP